MFKKKLLLLPVEVKPRELRSRLLLAAKAAERGFLSVVGPMGEVIQTAIKLGQGIYVDKALSFNQSAVHSLLHNNGVNVVSMDEEGLSSENNISVYKKMRLHSASLAIVDKVICWGWHEAETGRHAFPNYSDKFVGVGNPRLDLALSHKCKTQEGDRYILLLSNIAKISANGIGFWRKQLKAYQADLDDDDVNLRTQYRWLTLFKLAELYLGLVQQYPDRKFLIRPHPSEDHAFWQDMFQGFNNCAVRYDDNYEEVLASADLIVHSSCTSGVFANLMNKRCIAYVPFEKDPYAKFVGNRLGRIASSQEEVFSLIKDFLEVGDDQLAQENADRLKENFEYLSVVRERLCSERICDLFQDVSYRGSGIYSERLRYDERWNKVGLMWRYFKNRFLNGVSRAFSSDSKLQYSSRYEKQVFSGMTLAELQLILDEFVRSGLASHLCRIRRVGGSCFLVEVV